MTLDWTLDKVKDWETKCYITVEKDDPMQGIAAGDKVLNPVTNALIWATLTVKLEAITEKNYEDFYTRLALVEKMDGSWLRSWNEDTEQFEDRPITLAEVRDHIGLATNAFPSRTFRVFAYHFMNYEGQNLLRYAKRNEKKEKENAA